MNSFSLFFFFSWKMFILSSILSDSFSCRSLLYITLNTSCQSLLVWSVCDEKSANSLIQAPLWVTALLLPLKLFGCLVTVILIMICLGVGLFGFILIGTLCGSWTWVIFFLHQVKEVFCHYLFKKIFYLLLSSPSGTPMMQILLMLFQSFLKLSSFFLSLFCFCCSDRVFFFLYCLPNHWFNPLLHVAYF